MGALRFGVFSFGGAFFLLRGGGGAGGAGGAGGGGGRVVYGEVSVMSCEPFFTGCGVGVGLYISMGGRGGLRQSTGLLRVTSKPQETLPEHLLCVDRVLKREPDPISKAIHVHSGLPIHPGLGFIGCWV